MTTSEYTAPFLLLAAAGFAFLLDARLPAALLLAAGLGASAVVGWRASARRSGRPSVREAAWLGLRIHLLPLLAGTALLYALDDLLGLPDLLAGMIGGLAIGGLVGRFGRVRDGA